MTAHPSVCVLLVPAIKKLEQNQNGKLQLEIDHNSHYSCGYRAIHSAVLWANTALLYLRLCEVHSQQNISKPEQRHRKRGRDDAVWEGKEESTRKDWVLSVCAIAMPCPPPSPSPCG
jgi:hypothetical protein